MTAAPPVLVHVLAVGDYLSIRESIADYLRANDLKLTNKLALVSGSTAGIGFALAHEGARVSYLDAITLRFAGRPPE